MRHAALYLLLSVLPYRISSGFVSITLLFVLTRTGFSVAAAASIVAIGVSANPLAILVDGDTFF
jgi:hypothetical protein